MSRKNILETISGLLVLLFVYAAISKLLDYENFKIQLGKSPLLTSFAPWVAIGLPLLEIGISILLLSKAMRLLGFYASFFLLVLFTSYLTAILNYSYYIPCSCGGILRGLSWKTHIIFNLIFMAISVVGVIIQSATPKLDNSPYNNVLIK